MIKDFSHTTAPVAYDVLMRARYVYYCTDDIPLWSDRKYDLLEKDTISRWPWLEQALGVGSSDPSSYESYVIDGRRPIAHERERRDKHLATFMNKTEEDWC